MSAKRFVGKRKQAEFKSLKIVQVVNSLAVADGGPARNSFELNRALNRHSGCAADLYWIRGELADTVLVEGGSVVGDLPNPGPRQLSLRKNVERRRVDLFALVRAVAESDVVILHGYYLIWIPFVVLLAKVLRCRIFLMPHGSLTARQQKYSQGRKTVFDHTGGAIVRKFLTAFVTGSAIERDELALKFANARIEVAGVGVPLPQRFKSDELVHAPIRLLSMSRIASKKRIDLSIDAVSELSRAGLSATLTIAGTGPSELVDQLKRQANLLEVEESVSFVGQLSGKTKSQAFLDSDVFLLPSEDENFGIGFAEAISYGLPCVVSTGVAAAADLPSSAGKLLSNPDGVEIACAIKELVAPDAYLESQRSSRQFAAAHFSWAAAAESWLRVIRIEAPRK